MSSNWHVGVQMFNMKIGTALLAYWCEWRWSFWSSGQEAVNQDSSCSIFPSYHGHGMLLDLQYEYYHGNQTLRNGSKVVGCLLNHKRETPVSLFMCSFPCRHQ